MGEAHLGERVAEVLDQRGREAVDGTERRAQVVRDRVRERLELAIGRLELRGAFLHAALEVRVQAEDLLFRPPRAQELRRHPLGARRMAYLLVLLDEEPGGHVVEVRAHLVVDRRDLVRAEDAAHHVGGTTRLRVLTHPDHALAEEEHVEERLVVDDVAEVLVGPDLPGHVARRTERRVPGGHRVVVGVLQEAQHLVGTEVPVVEVVARVVEHEPTSANLAIELDAGVPEPGAKPLDRLAIADEHGALVALEPECKERDGDRNLVVEAGEHETAVVAVCNRRQHGLHRWSHGATPRRGSLPGLGTVLTFVGDTHDGGSETAQEASLRWAE